MNTQPKEIYLKDDNIFPNSYLPALLYKGVLELPFLFPGHHVADIFSKNNWTNSWKSGIFQYQHYHSVTHEVLGVYEGETTVLLGGENGTKVNLEKGDVLVIPAGVAHKNLEKEDQIKCVGAYPDGRNYDMNYGKAGERPRTDKNISDVPIPSTDPVLGTGEGLTKIWH
jgi:uncharacterized protein YjlB